MRCRRISILSSFVVPLNFSNYHWIASINKASTEYISPLPFFFFLPFFYIPFLFFFLPLFSIPPFSLHSFPSSSFFFFLSFCRLVRNVCVEMEISKAQERPIKPEFPGLWIIYVPSRFIIIYRQFTAR